MDLFDQVSEDIKTAMKAKDKVALETLRNIKKFFLEAKTAPGANDILTDDAALKIIQKLVKQGKDSAEIYIGQGRQDLAADACKMFYLTHICNFSLNITFTSFTTLKHR